MLCPTVTPNGQCWYLRELRGLTGWEGAQSTVYCGWFFPRLLEKENERFRTGLDDSGPSPFSVSQSR